MLKRVVVATVAVSSLLAGGLASLHPAAALDAGVAGDARSSHIGSDQASSVHRSVGQPWSKLGRTTDGLAQPGLVSGVPGQDIYLHVLWARPSAGDASLTDLVRTRITASGDVSITDPVVSGWYSIDSVPDLVISGVYSSLMAIWGGTRSLDPNETNSRISVAWPPPPGTSDPWTLEAGDVAGGRATSIGATSPGGNLNFTWYETAGVLVHHGLDPSTPDYNLQTQLGGFYGYSPDIASGAAGTWVAWYSSATGNNGVWAQQVDPASGAPVGSAVKMPGSTTRFDGVDRSIQQSTRTPIAAGSSVDDPNTYVAYTGGYPSSTKMLVWRIRPGGPAADSVVVGKGVSVHAPAVTTDADGHAWAAWSEGGTGTSRIFARRSNVGGTVWGATVRVPLPQDDTGCQTLFNITPETPIDGDLDILATLSQGCLGGVALWHTEIEPGLSLSAKPLTFTGKQKLTFKVFDAGEPVQGAKVTVDGESDRTDAQGIAHIVLGPYSKDRKLVATATHDGYVPDKVTIHAHN